MRQRQRHLPLRHLLREAEQETVELARDERAVTVVRQEDASGVRATITVSGDVAPGAEAHPRLERVSIEGTESFEGTQIRVHERLWRRMVAEHVALTTILASMDSLREWTAGCSSWLALSPSGTLSRRDDVGDWTSLSLLPGEGVSLLGLSETCERCCDAQAIPMRQTIERVIGGSSHREEVEVFACASCGMRSIPEVAIWRLEDEIVERLTFLGAPPSSDSLRFLRTRAGFSVEGLASLIGFTAAEVQAWEQGAPVHPSAWVTLMNLARETTTPFRDTYHALRRLWDGRMMSKAGGWLVAMGFEQAPDRHAADVPAEASMPEQVKP
jgi:transcriptional regulator with XRE-family HTH domain